MKRVPRHQVARLETVAFDQFLPCHALQHIENGWLIDGARSDLRVATLPRLKREFKRRDLFPERIVVEWFEPLLHIFHVIERIHPEMVPDCRSQMQIAPNL